MKDQCHPSHTTRVSFDASSWDEICVNCGATDVAGGGWGNLRYPCKGEPVVQDTAWKEYEGDFNALTDRQIEQESEIARRDMDEAESWLEAVASWERAGKPRTPLHIEKRPANCRNRLRDEGKAYPKSGCLSCGTGGMTGCPYERR